MRIVPEARAKVKVGERFTRLVVLGPPFRIGKNNRVVCQCDCGRVTVPTIPAIIRGHTVSCGCHARDVASEQARSRTGTRHRNFKHGLSCEDGGCVQLLKCLWSMKSRCGNPRDKFYKWYGGRGIRVCDEWQDAVAFSEWAKKSGWRPGLTIDRIDNDGNYEPGNCRWATRAEQSRNTSRNRWVEAFGKRLTVTDWESQPEMRVSSRTFRRNLKAGVPPEIAMTCVRCR